MLSQPLTLAPPRGGNRYKTVPVGAAVLRAKCPECPVERQARALQSTQTARAHRGLLCQDFKVQPLPLSGLHQSARPAPALGRKLGRGVWFSLASSTPRPLGPQLPGHSASCPNTTRRPFSGFSSPWQSTRPASHTLRGAPLRPRRPLPFKGRRWKPRQRPSLPDPPGLLQNLKAASCPPRSVTTISRTDFLRPLPTALPPFPTPYFSPSSEVFGA